MVCTVTTEMLMPAETPSRPFEIGLYTFAERTPDPKTDKLISSAERLRNLLERVELADQVGLDVFALGEHHRPDFVSSAPDVILAAAAARTQRIRLSSAVTVLSSDDPVRVFQRFATLDLLSNGRAEIMAGRGSFIESFPLFGYDLRDYNTLFSENWNFAQNSRFRIRYVVWHTPSTAARTRRLSTPIARPVADLGCRRRHAESVVRAATLGLSLAIAIIGGYPEQFAPLVDLYWRAVDAAGHDRSQLHVSINSHGHIADDSRQAIDEAFPPFKMVMDKIGRERGWSPMSRQQFDRSTTLRGANFIGNPDDVIEKILFQHDLFQAHRFAAIELSARCRMSR